MTEKEAAELRDARKRIRLLEQENEILRRAGAFFARDTGENRVKRMRSSQRIWPVFATKTLPDPQSLPARAR